MKLNFKNLKHTFRAHKYRNLVQQKLVQIFLEEEAGAFENNI